MITAGDVLSWALAALFVGIAWRADAVHKQRELGRGRREMREAARRACEKGGA